VTEPNTNTNININKNKNQSIDAENEIKQAKDERSKELENELKNDIKGERGASSLGDKRRLLPAGSKAFLAAIIICSIAICTVLIWRAFEVRNNQQTVSSANRPIANTLPPLELSPATSKEVQLEEEAASLEPSHFETEPAISPEVSVRQRRLTSNLIGKDSKINGANRENQAASASSHNQDEFKGSDGELQSKLQPLRLTPSVAGALGDRDYLLTQGAMIDCQLETRLVTTQPGMASCYTTRNVYSANGRVVLIDKGSKVVGHYQGGITQGQARIFVLWTRVETPKGVIINIDSPGAGFLGESGLGGYIDTHFWQRFGGAIMMSLIGDLGEYAANRGNKSSRGNTIQFNNTAQGMQDAATEALKNSINIPPTLYKNQGERISIFVARDLDFEEIYGLEYER